MVSLRQAVRSVVFALLLVSVSSCSTNPATGKKQLALIGEQQEIAMGRDAHQQIVAQMGLYDDPELQEYIQGLGETLAAESERPNLPWTFTVLDDPVVNAFALPGGYIYVTRGILAHLNSEAELVGVLGHEIGHVTARHGVNRLSKAQLATIGLGVGMVLEPGLQRFGDLAQTGLGLLFLKYSRDDERQSDDLGLRYAMRSNYDVRHLPNVYDVLRRVSENAGAGRVPNWLATHPDPESRRQRMLEAVDAQGADFSDLRVARRPYMQQLDGLVFGANPREGYFEGSRFLHPDLAFELRFPDGWSTQNQRQAVVAVSDKKDAAIQLTLVAETNPKTAAREFAGQNGVRSGNIESGRVGGFPASSVRFEADVQGGTLAGRALFLRKGDNTYRLMGYTTQDKWRGYSRTMDRSLQSFKELTDREALNVQPARLDLVDLERGLTLEQFQQSYPSSVPLETLGLINHADPGSLLAGGQLAKRVVGGPDGQ